MSLMPMVSPGAGAIAYRYFRINVSASTGASWVGSGELNIREADTTEHPSSDLTSNSAPSPFVASASSIFDVGTEFKLFNGAILEQCFTAIGNLPWWVKIDLGAGNEIVPFDFKLNASGQTDRQVGAFTFEGSNDDSAWTVLSTQTGITW